jgi:regulatory protein
MRRSGPASSADRTAASRSEGGRFDASCSDRASDDEASSQEEAVTAEGRAEAVDMPEFSGIGIGGDELEQAESQDAAGASGNVGADRGETRGRRATASRGSRSKSRSGESTTPDAYRQALGLLVRREHSRSELQRKLRARGADPVEAATALDTLHGQGYQDDARFAEMLIRTRIGGGYGPLHIRAELGVHRLDADTALQAMIDAEPDWPALALQALQRRFGGRAPRDRAEALKRGHFLQRRGFDASCIRYALDHFVAG